MMDLEIKRLIEAERIRQTKGIELIASENYVSDDVLTAAGSILTNKYAEGYPSKRYYGGCEVVDEVELLAQERLKKMFGATWVNVQPHSGSQANAAVMLALLNPGDKILGFDLSHGGHLTHGSSVSFSGKLYEACFYSISEETNRLDYDNIEQKAKEEKPKLIIAGASSYTKDWDYKIMRSIADSVGAMLMADIAHPAGLIASGLLNNPMPYCHVVTSTTHKTIRGPRGGIIMMGEDMPNKAGIKTKKGTIRTVSSLLDSAVFPGTQGGPLEHIIAAKAVAFGEALKPEFKIYSKQVIDNAKRMSNKLINLGYKVVTGGTENHCILLDLRNKDISGKEAEALLGKVDITVNKNMVPFDDKPPFVTSGIRIGTPAITTRGLDAKDVDRIVSLINRSIEARTDEVELGKVKKEVNEFMSVFPLFK